MSKTVHQFTTSGWFLLVATFTIGFGLGKYDYQIECLLNSFISSITGVACYPIGPC